MGGVGWGRTEWGSGVRRRGNRGERRVGGGSRMRGEDVLEGEGGKSAFPEEPERCAAILSGFGVMGR